jgi:hypothetical protein
MLTFDLVLAHVDVRRWRRHIAGEVVDHLVCLKNTQYSSYDSKMREW